ncbi:hypothetical protein [Granulicella sp. S190]|uniref:hypothetical protein n=1 Tax=Granulicella sp. S190 TaxID=1747226 RepID=UPI00131B5266|nr:hypothetical protein [Granulicella sp. S190]
MQSSTVSEALASEPEGRLYEGEDGTARSEVLGGWCFDGEVLKRMGRHLRAWPAGR